MSYRIAGIDVHKKMLAVVIADVSGTGPYEFQRRKFGARPSELQVLAQWLDQQEVEEVVMESTAQYWRPVWQGLERYWQPARKKREGASPKSGTLHLAQAQSNQARHGRKKDFPDAERLVKRLVANELVLSYVPAPEQRLWRTVSQRKYQLTQDRTRLRNQLEGLLEEAGIKLSGWVSDLLGLSSRRMLKALGDGETDAAVLAGLADRRLRASQEELRDALGACAQLHSSYRSLLRMLLEELALLDKNIGELDKHLAQLLEAHQQAVHRLAEVPGLGADSAQQIIAQIGPSAAVFPSADSLVGWVGVYPGDNESAEESKGHRSPKGNRTLRRLLTQAANAAIKYKGSIFEMHYRRLAPRLQHKGAVWAIAHRLCKLIWIILHRGVRYQEQGPAVRARSRKARTARMIKELRHLGYRIEPLELAVEGTR
jgi:transposase